MPIDLTLQNWPLIGLSKERPILGHHAKAHILKSGGFHLKSGGFQVKSTQNLIKANVSTKTIQFDECRRGAMTQDFMKNFMKNPGS